MPKYRGAFMNLLALRSQLTALDPPHPSIKHSVERIQREIAMSKPEDVTQDVRSEAAHVGSTVRMALAELAPRQAATLWGTPEVISIMNAHIARAIMAAKAEERRSMSNPWSPLTSAPANGTWVFLYVPGHGPARAIWKGRWISHVSGREITKATHWMPLPPPPSP